MPRAKDYEKVVFENAEGIRDTKTGAGLWCKLEDREDLICVAKSQIHDDSEVYKVGTTGKLIVPRWIAEQNGWI